MQRALTVNKDRAWNGKTAAPDDIVMAEKPVTNLARLAYLFPSGAALTAFIVSLLPISWDIQSAIYVMAGVCIISGLFYTIRFHIGLKLPQYTVTGSYIEARTGILEKRVRRIPLVYVRDVTLRQGFYQRILGTSNINVSATNGDTIEFENITEGERKQELIWDLVLAKSPNASRTR